LNSNLYERVAKRRAKAQRPLLLKFLQEIGYDDIFNVDEVNEIKALYDKAQEEMKENLEAEKAGEAASMSYTDKLEEKMLANSKDDPQYMIKTNQRSSMDNQKTPKVSTSNQNLTSEHISIPSEI